MCYPPLHSILQVLRNELLISENPPLKTHTHTQLFNLKLVINVYSLNQI